MNNQLHCTWCQQPRSVFQFRHASSALVCGACCQLETEAGEGVPMVTYRALSHLCGRIGRKSIRDKAMALVRHDRALRGAA